MASTPDCRVASAASLSAPAGCTGYPLASDTALSATDELLQRQLDELAAIHRRLRGLLAPLRIVDEPGPPLCPRNGDFLLLPEIQRFRHAAVVLEAECGTLLWTTQTRLTRLRSAICALRELRELRELGGANHVCH